MSTCSQIATEKCKTADSNGVCTGCDEGYYLKSDKTCPIKPSICVSMNGDNCVLNNNSEVELRDFGSFYVPANLQLHSSGQYILSSCNETINSSCRNPRYINAQNYCSDISAEIPSHNEIRAIFNQMRENSNLVYNGYIWNNAGSVSDAWEPATNPVSRSTAQHVLCVVRK